jgi:hypothetical protein
MAFGDCWRILGKVLANVGKSGESSQKWLGNVGKSGEYQRFPNKTMNLC